MHTDCLGEQEPAAVLPFIAPRKSIVRTASSSVVLRAVSLGCTLIQVPLVMPYLGPELFGFWMLLVAIGTFFGLSDLGISSAFQNDVTLACSSGRKARLRPMFLTAQITLLMFSLATGGLLLAVAASIGKVTFFQKLSPDLADNSVFFLLVYVAIGGLNVPLALGSRLAFGLHRGYLANLASMTAQILTLGCMAAAARSHFSFPLFLAAATLPTLLCNLVLSVLLFFQLESVSGPAFEGLDYAKHTVSSGLPFLALSASLPLFFAAGPLMLSSTLGPIAVAAYNLSTRALGIVHNLESGVLGALWPSLTDALEHKDFVWARRCIFRSIAFTSGVFCLPTLLFPFIAPKLLSYWSGMPAASFPAWMIWPLTLLFAGIFFQGPFYIALSAGGAVTMLAACHFAAAAAALALSSFWKAAPEMLPASMAIAFALFGIVPPIVQTTRIYRLWPSQ